MKKRLFTLLIIASVFTPLLSRADVFDSTNFKALDPVLNGGHYATSTSYQLHSSIFQIAIGTSTATGYEDKAGFLYFPAVTIPVLSATAGNAQVVLSWSSATGYLGWTVSGYNVGQSTASGGPYTYTSVGNVLTSTMTGLTSGTTYYFVIRPEDSFGNSIATSSQISAIPTGGGGGGGGGGGIISSSQVTLAGFAYPFSQVTVFDGGRILGQTQASASGSFSIRINNLSGGLYSFLLFAEDVDGVLSASVSLAVSVPSQSALSIADIYFSPTVSIEEETIKRGDHLNVFGYAQSNVVVSLSISGQSGDSTIGILEALAGEDGRYKAEVPTGTLEYGRYALSAKLKILLGQTGNFLTRYFTVGEKTVKLPKDKCPVRGDLNADCKINLTDFSIGAFWWKRAFNPAFSEIEKRELNGDGIMDLVDFSIMAYYWTG